MFEGLLREIKRLERGQTISINLPADRDGFIDRECPSKTCKAQFKIKKALFSQRSFSSSGFCPICRTKADSNSFATKSQIEYGRQIASNHLRRQVGAALQRGAASFNRQPQSGFLRFSLSVQTDSVPVYIPFTAAKVMEQRFECECCACTYASIGAAFFCPRCGHNSVVTSFSYALEAVRNTLAATNACRQAVEQSVGKDAAADTLRFMIEQSLIKVVGGFENFSSALFARTAYSQTVAVQRGAFQRLKEASDLWQAAIGHRYETILAQEEYEFMSLFFQKRHLIAHKDGIVDQRYLTETGDRASKEGQRLVIRSSEILRLVDIIDKLAAALRNQVGI